MSLIRGGGVRVFPMAWIKECIQTYTESHGKAPRVLVISSEDAIDYGVSCTMPKAAALGLEKIMMDHDLESGEIDLAV